MNRVAVIVAMTDDCTNLDARLARFVEEAGPGGEVILVDATTRSVGHPANVRVLRRPPGTLVPDLWRDGLVATSAPLVAFTTSNMRPGRGWFAALEHGLETAGAVCAGGPIEPADRLSITDRAVALLRYSGYFPPLPDPSRIAPPGENAIYRRDALIEVESAWTDGFWEVAVQKALRARGYSMTMAEAASVTFEGVAGLADMVRRRLLHGRNYGKFRSDGVGLGTRIARVMMTPVVPALLAVRALAALRARRISVIPWLASLPTLMILATAWAIGEAIGTCRTSIPVVPSSVPMKLRACKDQP